MYAIQVGDLATQFRAASIHAMRSGVLLEAKKRTAKQVKDWYETHGAALAAFACSYGLDFASAEDVVQHVFLNLLRGVGADLQSPVAYFYRAVRNGAINFHRVRQRETALPEGDEWLVSRGKSREEILAVQQALQYLPEEQREVVFLRIWSGLTLQEIAGAMETPLNTVASRFRYALDKLRERLASVETK
jgi:RNA polymerase sigma-70 factor, ECF subfamily